MDTATRARFTWPEFVTEVKRPSCERGLVLPFGGQALLPILFNSKEPKRDDDSQRQLQKIYDPDITSLEELLGRELPELRRSWI